MFNLKNIISIIALGFAGFFAYFFISLEQELPSPTPTVDENSVEVESDFELVQPEVVVEEIEVRKPNSAKLLFFGDTALLDPLGGFVLEDSNYTPFENVQDKFSEYDFVVGKLETTIDGASVGLPAEGKAYVFSIPAISAKIFRDAGIDAFSYATNHTRDYGPSSVLHTIALLTDQNIGVFGAGANKTEAFTPLVRELNGVKIALLAFNSAEYAYNIATDTMPGTACFCEQSVRDSIAYASTIADIVIVYSEAGTEHQTYPDQLQTTWANIYTSAGADLVVGGHPHVRQPMEVVNGIEVYHSLGNFMFPGMAWNPEAQKGWALEVLIEDKNIIDTNLLDMQMDDFGVPRWIY